MASIFSLLSSVACKFGNFIFQGLDIRGPLQDVLAVQLAQADFSDKFGLDGIDAKTLHQVGR